MALRKIGRRLKKAVLNKLSSKPITYKKPRTVRIKTRKKAKPAVKPRMKQYGDKGYRPSTGTGVGH